MNENEKIIKDAITTADLAAGGLLNKSQARYFIEQMFDSTDLLKACRTVTMDSPKMEIDKIGIGSRIARGRSYENQDVSESRAKIVYGSLELDAKEYVLPWSHSKRVRKDSIEGANHPAHIADLMSRQFGLDLQDVGINGDMVYSSNAPTTVLAADIDNASDGIDIKVSSIAGFPRSGEAGYIKIDNEYFKYEKVAISAGPEYWLKNCQRAMLGSLIAAHNGTSTPASVTWVRDELIGHDDGWLKKMYEKSHYVDFSTITPVGGSAGQIGKDMYFALYKGLPDKYKTGGQEANLRWMISSYQKNLWIESLTSRATSAGDAVLGGADFKPLGIPHMVVPGFPKDTIALTDPRNLIYAIWDQIKIESTSEGKEALYKSEIYYLATIRADFEIENAEAAAFGDGLKL